MVGVPRPGRQRGVYGISVAAELVGMGVQKLRSNEARGCLSPSAPRVAPAATAPTTWTGYGGSATCWTPG
jgi:hypothetical protein